MTETGQERGSARGVNGELVPGAPTIEPEDGDATVVGWFLGTVFDVLNEKGDPFRSPVMAQSRAGSSPAVSGVITT